MKKTFRMMVLITMALSLSACKPPSQRKRDVALFILAHPIAALAIGKKTHTAENITSNAVRFAVSVGFKDTEFADGRGTQVNAIRHTLWQATISSRFSADIAKAVGDAYEKNSQALETPPDRFYNLHKADESIDLHNNVIGRQLGTDHPDTSMKELTRLILDHDHTHGLWKATAHEDETGKPYWTISTKKMATDDYVHALKLLDQLNEVGKPK